MKQNALNGAAPLQMYKSLPASDKNVTGVSFSSVIRNRVQSKLSVENLLKIFYCRCVKELCKI